MKKALPPIERPDAGKRLQTIRGTRSLEDFARETFNVGATTYLNWENGRFISIELVEILLEKKLIPSADWFLWGIEPMDMAPHTTTLLSMTNEVLQARDLPYSKALEENIHGFWRAVQIETGKISPQGGFESGGKKPEGKKRPNSGKRAAISR